MNILRQCHGNGESYEEDNIYHLLLLWAVAAYAEGIGTYKDLLEFAAASNSGQTLTNGKMPTAHLSYGRH